MSLFLWLSLESSWRWWSDGAGWGLWRSYVGQVLLCGDDWWQWPMLPTKNPSSVTIGCQKTVLLRNIQYYCSNVQPSCWRGLSPRRSTDIALFLWTTSPDCVLCTSKLMIPVPRPCLLSKRLISLLLSTVSASYTIIVIMDNVLTVPGSNHARSATNGLISAAWLPISRMGLPSMQFRICWRAPTSSYSMLVLAGW